MTQKTNQVTEQIQTEPTEQLNNRLVKARHLVDAGKVRRSTANPNMWMIGSGTLNTPNLFWKVEHIPELNQITCECPDFSIAGNTCKHLIAVCLFQADIANKNQVEEVETE